MNSMKYWIALEQTSGIGPASLIEIHQSLQKSGISLSDLVSLTPAEITEECRFSEKITSAIAGLSRSAEAIEEDYFRLIDAGIEVIPFFSDRYPARLREILGNTIPPLLYVLGNAGILQSTCVAILGDRDVSDKGEMISFSAAGELARHGICVVSGLAKGAECIAHRASLISGGTTIAFIPSGIFHLKVPEILQDVFDPERIAIVSQFYPTREANRYLAYARNRTICALARAVYIVEAPIEGGIFEAAKSAHSLKVPLFTTQYAEYPKNAGGNKIILKDMNGIPVHGRIEGTMIVPNMDRIIGAAKFGIAG